jgi:hypothetical protein
MDAFFWVFTKNKKEEGSVIQLKESPTFRLLFG